MDEHGAGTLPPDEDPEYDAYLEEIHRAEEEAIRSGSRTQEYLIFVQETRKAQYTVEFLGRAYRKKRNELTQHIDTLGQQAKQEPDHLTSLLFDKEAEGIQAGLAALEGSYLVVAQSQRQVYYAHLVNALENYLIDVAKKLLVQYPGSLRAQLRQELTAQFSYWEVKGYLGQSAELENYLLDKIIEAAERNYTMFGVLKVLQGFASMHVPVQEERPLKRAAAVRHKITHRNGKVDAKFLDDIAALQDVPGSPSEYDKVGTAPVRVGTIYEVSEEEFAQVGELVSKVALTVEQVVAQHYPALVYLDPWDFSFHMRDMEDGLDVLES